MSLLLAARFRPENNLEDKKLQCDWRLLQTRRIDQCWAEPKSRHSQNGDAFATAGAGITMAEKYRRGIIHCHSYHSYDCAISIAAYLRLAKKYQLDFIVLTDHD